jgi:phospholipid/cholesterol/gamma-HCH transport system substrate-binding protein
MKLKFNQFERVAGIFVIIAVAGSVFLTGIAAIKKGWFTPKIEFYTTIQSADSIHSGTPVTMSGLRIGEVESIELISGNEIRVHFFVFENYGPQIKSDSKVEISRPFIIGEKALEITVGTSSLPLAVAGTEIPSTLGFDMMDLLSGKKLGPFLGTLEGLATNLSTLAKEFSDPKRTRAFVKMFDRMEPLLMSVNKMGNEMATLGAELNVWLPQLRKQSPQIGSQIATLINRVDQLTEVLVPVMEAIGPELPQSSKRALEALDEVVVTLKAMQKSFLLRGNVEDVREEEAARQPANK